MQSRLKVNSAFLSFTLIGVLLLAILFRFIDDQQDRIGNFEEEAELSFTQGMTLVSLIRTAQLEMVRVGVASKEGSAGLRSGRPQDGADEYGTALLRFELTLARAGDLARALHLTAEAEALNAVGRRFHAHAVRHADRTSRLADDKTGPPSGSADAVEGLDGDAAQLEAELERLATAVMEKPAGLLEPLRSVADGVRTLSMSGIALGVAGFLLGGAISAVVRNAIIRPILDIAAFMTAVGKAGAK